MFIPTEARNPGIISVEVPWRSIPGDNDVQFLIDGITAGTVCKPGFHYSNMDFRLFKHQTRSDLSPGSIGLLPKSSKYQLTSSDAKYQE